MPSAKRHAAALFLCLVLMAATGCGAKSDAPVMRDHAEIMSMAEAILPVRYDFGFGPVTVSERLTEHWQPAIPDIPLKKAAPASAFTPYTGGIQPYFDDNLAGQVLTLINQYRAEAGLSALAWDSNLAGAAAVRAREIVSYYSHTRPSGAEFQTVIAGLSGYARVGENLCQGYSTAEDIMTAFMNSEGHRNCILGDFTQVGVGVYRAANGRYYCGQIFGKTRAT